MFSAQGIAAMTLILGLRSAITFIVARMEAAPAMSSFISSMPLASLIDRPPESKAMPLPVSATGVARPAPVYRSSIIRGGLALPCPTPRIPPKPPCLNWGSVQTLQVSPTWRAIDRASFAMAAGDMSAAGVFTRSRAQQTASTSPAASRTAARIALVSQRGAPRTVTFFSDPPSPCFER